MGLLRKLFKSASAPSMAEAAATARVRGIVGEAPPSPRGAETGLQPNPAVHRGQALALASEAVGASPNDPSPLFARAGILYDWGRYREAQADYLRASEKGLRSAELFLQLGRLSLRNGNIAEAEAQFRRAIAEDANAVAAHRELGMALRARQKPELAIASLDRALDLDPADIETLLALGSCRAEQQDATAGEALFRRAIALDPGRGIAWQNLGVALRMQGRHDEALQAFERAEPCAADEGGSLDSFTNFAIELREQGRLGDAIAKCEQWLPRQPTTFGHYIYSHLLLTAGRLAEAWPHYEFRWLNEPLVSHPFRLPRPPWAGQDLRGKTIRLRVEQGLGDIIQFVRYAPMLKSLGATVELGKFEGLALDFAGIDRVVDAGESAQAFDYHVNLMGLPRIFGTDLATIPANVPYVGPSPEKMAAWAPRLPADERMLNVGLVWAGNPAHSRDRARSLSLDTLAPLAQVAGVKWFSLQKGAREAEAATAPPGFDFVNLGPELADFSDTAAVIAHVDLVVCVDTAVAHLAGAMGKTIWTLIAEPADFRWLDGRDDSPWYPTMRLFRQRRSGDWQEVILRVRDALEARVSALRSDARAPAGPQSAPGLPAILLPDRPRDARPGFSAVTETRHGILQYLPHEPVEGDSIAWYGEYLQPQLNLLARMMRPGSTVLEVGPGVGAHALFLAAAIGRTGHLILDERRPVHGLILRQNLAANRVTNATLLDNARADASGQGRVETVDDLHLESLDWLKACDGTHSLQALDGAAETLWRLRPMLFCAAPDEQALAVLAERAKGYGYRGWRMSVALFDPGNFNRRGNDIFGGATALALLALPEEIRVDMAIDGCVEIS